jgi:tripartite-type tricarboxylate transporter receptor subunit TctC
MLVNTPALPIAAAVMKGLSFRPVEDLAPVSKLGTTPAALLVSPKIPANTVAELVTLAKAAPGRYSFASPGPATSLHLAGELFKITADIDIVHVPYRGGAPALVDVMAGQPEIIFNPLIDILPHVREGRLKALAVTTRERSPVLPDLPTIAESGLPEYEFSLWYGLFAPRGTPELLIERISRDVREVLHRESVRERFAASGVTIAGTTPDAFAAELRDEVEKWSRLARRIGLNAG